MWSKLTYQSAILKRNFHTHLFSYSNRSIILPRSFCTSTASMKTYQDAIHALNNLQTNFANIQQTRLTGNRNTATLDQMFEFSKRIGYDSAEYDRLNLVHITGTKGKGSTSALIYSLLAQYANNASDNKISKIGLYTSPHLKSVRERICINGEPLSEELFTKYFFEVHDLLIKTNDDPNLTTDLTRNEMPAYFKFLTLLSFYAFMKEGVNAAIYEVGIGGELDSTNIIRNPIACGVSSIAIDHTFVLGNTLGEISWNKSGIFKKGSAAFSVIQKPESEKVLKERAIEKGSSLDFVDVHPLLKDGKVKLGIDGDVQKINASLAVAITFQFLKKLDIPIYDSIPNDQVPSNISDVKDFPQKILDGLAKAHIDGRAQTLKDKVDQSLTWYIDGSHTVESINRSSTWWKNKMIEQQKTSPNAYKNSIKILFFNQQSRNIEELLTELYSVLEDAVKFDYAIFTTNVTWADNKYDINLVSMNVDEKAVDALEMQKRSQKQWEELEKATNKKLGQKHSTEISVLHDIETGANLVREVANQNPDKTVDVFVCGSLHLVGGLLVVLDGKH